MKKWTSGLLALLLALSVCAGCGEKTEEPDESGNIYFEITGVKPDETLMGVGDRLFSAEMYYYWVAYNCSNLEYNLTMANAYSGGYGELFGEDGKILWDGQFLDGLTLGQYAKKQSEDVLKSYAALESAAAEYGITLTDEDKEALKKDLATAQEQAGGEEKFKESLDMMGISQETFDRISATNYLYNHLLEMVTEEGSDFYLEPEGYNQFAAYADHILLAKKDLSTNTDLSEEEAAAKRETAENLLAQLQAADDVETLFAQLADENSEDTGRASNPDGYVFGKGEMVQEFEDAAFSLEPGQISGIVETTYGYHIILRKDLLKKLKDDPELKSQLESQHLNKQLQERVEGMAVELSDKLENFDVGSFYASYMEAVQLRAGTNAPENGGTSGEDGADSAEGGNE